MLTLGRRLAANGWNMRSRTIGRTAWLRSAAADWRDIRPEAGRIELLALLGRGVDPNHVTVLARRRFLRRIRQDKMACAISVQMRVFRPDRYIAPTRCAGLWDKLQSFLKGHVF